MNFEEFICVFSGNLTAALNIPILTKYKITNILTVDTCPLPRTVSCSPNINIKFIQGINDEFII